MPKSRPDLDFVHNKTFLNNLRFNSPMDETKYIWMDGKLVGWKEAKVHVLCHTLHYGLGVFEGIRFYNTDKGPAVFRLKDHIRRLFNGAKKIFMAVPFQKTK